jgi:hypothetical protein
LRDYFHLVPYIFSPWMHQLKFLFFSVNFWHFDCQQLMPTVCPPFFFFHSNIFSPSPSGKKKAFPVLISLLEPVYCGCVRKVNYGLTPSCMVVIWVLARFHTRIFVHYSRYIAAFPSFGKSIYHCHFLSFPFIYLFIVNWCLAPNVLD